MAKGRKSLARQYCRQNTQVVVAKQTGAITQVGVILVFDSFVIRGDGLTRCGPQDIWNEERGFEIAKGRADKNAAMQLERSGLAPWKTGQ